MSPAEKHHSHVHVFNKLKFTITLFYIIANVPQTCIDIPVLAVSRLFAHEPSYWPYLPVEFPVAQWSSICSSHQKNIGLTPVKKTHILFISIPLFHYCILMDIDGDNTWSAPFAVLCARFHSFFFEASFERLPYRPTLMSQIKCTQQHFWNTMIKLLCDGFTTVSTHFKNITHAFLRGQ